MPLARASEIAKATCAALCRDVDACIQQHFETLSKMDSLADMDDIGLAFELWLDDLSSHPHDSDSPFWNTILETFQDCQTILQSDIKTTLSFNIEVVDGDVSAEKRIRDAVGKLKHARKAIASFASLINEDHVRSLTDAPFEEAGRHVTAAKHVSTIEDGHRMWNDDVGRSAAELFLRRTGRACSNHVILRKILATSHRPSANAHEVDDWDLSDEHVLPTLDKLKKTARGFEKLCCPCDLCGSHNVNISTLSDDNLIALAVLLSCGCLFAFKSFKSNLASSPLPADQTLQAFATEVFKAPGTLFGRGPDNRTVPVCSRNASECFPRRQNYAAICVQCKAKAFCAAVNLKARMFNIPKVMKSDVILDWNNCNIPLLNDVTCDHDRKKANVEYSCAEIEPTACSEGFGHREVFRKKYFYLRSKSETQSFDDALREAQIAMRLTKVHTNIVDILFAFETQDEDWRRVELVFARYESTLEKYLTLGRNDPRAGIRSSLIQDDLWMAMVNVVGAIASMHQFVEQDVSPRFSGHFDIKPANILIQGSGNSLKLVLTDFEQAAKNKAGDISYAPPENSASDSLRPAYDVWSLACILIRCLIFIESGPKGLETFVGGLGNTGGPFMLWEGSDHPGNTRLSTIVSNELARMQNESDRSTRRITAQIQKMLNINPSHRPTSRECYKEFSQAEAMGFVGDLDHMACGLERWITSTTRFPLSAFSRQTPRSVPVCLYLWRTSRQSTQEEKLYLEMEGEEVDTLIPCSQVRYQPLAFYDKPLFETPNESRTGQSFSCRFDGLREDRMFHFDNMKHYLSFMTLMTQYQIVCTGDSIHGLQTWCESATLKLYRRMGDSTIELGSGNAQIWKLLGDNEYDEIFCRKGRPTAVDPQQPVTVANPARRPSSQVQLMEMTRTVKTNVWKLALWTHTRPEDGNTRRVCIVVDSKSIEPQMS